MKNKKFYTITALLVILSLLLGACGNKPEEGAAVKETLTVVTQTDARTIDPHGSGDSASVQALLPVVENLLTMNDAGETVAGLAESWEQVGEKSWKFTLRKGVKFHNGEELKASDVVYSFKRALSDKGARVQYIMRMIDPDGFEIIDDHTVVISTVEVFTPFLEYLPYIGAAIISEKAYEDPAAELHPVGTGPYKFVRWEKGTQLVYERFDDYWGDKANFKELVIKIIPEANNRLIELETGNADIACNLTQNEIQRVRDSDKLDLYEANTTVFSSLYLNTQKAPMDNVKFRQAIDYAIDSAAIVQAVFRGAADVTPGPINSTMRYFDDREPNDRYDPEKAKQLIEESGVVLDRPLQILSNDIQNRIDTCVIVESQLKEIGIESEVIVMESAAQYAAAESGEYDMAFSGWGAVGFKDPDNNLYGPFHSAGIPYDNYAFLNDPVLDEMLDRSRTTPDGPEREALAKEIQAYLRDVTPILAFENPKNYVGTQKNIGGFTARSPMDQFFNNVFIKND